jgi:hypothetical protein
MSVRNPKNQVKTNLYTSGGEYIYKKSGLDYVGPYYVINNKPYAGVNEVVATSKPSLLPREIKAPNPNTPNVKIQESTIVMQKVEPIELDINPNFLPVGADTNILSAIGNAVGFFTQAYNFAKSNVETAKDIKDKVFPSKNIQNNQPRTGIHYFSQNLGDPNKIIKEIDLTAYNQLSKDPMYKTVSIDFSSNDVDKQKENGEKIIPGLTTFLSL